ncbi:MAG: hypothetical protein P1Q69_20950 [Candidatus Thorarchaeota archaeon]|nr:hypothetical protein [Candidatus Thorarchaeota archaeon]
MEYVDYYAVVGVSPMACVNSLCSFTSNFPHVRIRNLSFIVSLTERGDPSLQSMKTVESINHALSISTSAPNLPIPLASDYLWIPEADLEGATKNIITGVLSRTTDGSRVIVDATAGRKIMASSAVVAALLLSYLHGIPVDINYYLLKAYDNGTKAKEFSDLEENDALTLVFDTEQILRAFGLEMA